MSGMRLCDSHCHLDFSEFDSTRSQLLESCFREGVEAIVVPGVLARHWPRLLRLCQQHASPQLPALMPALGLHPCFIDQHCADDLARLEQLVAGFCSDNRSQTKLVAIGEIGLDFWHPDSDRSLQLELFVKQLRLAQSYDLPVLLHARKSHDLILKQLRRLGFSAGGIVHAFSGSLQQAEQYVAMGFKLGVGGAVTYPRATKLRSTIERLGVDHWVLETDAPDMPMAGRQGQLNQPDYLPQVLAVLADLFQVPALSLAKILWRNTETVLGTLPR